MYISPCAPILLYMVKSVISVILVLDTDINMHISLCPYIVIHGKVRNIGNTGTGHRYCLTLIAEPVPAHDQPNRFTYAYQNIVDSYGIARYQVWIMSW